ncbi:hypothetical protein [Natronolimnohabitans innermongolicus]|uniref:DUF7979 domain-containing protein n=1 Tax=Natronolimnohabitans innermongolicus JCM 12255 TaxID=1227499 RepID=L9X7U8_9EURY|nr:hypothetical protein [Natronolimnohabitans innermongolicus]ELY57486.1 hypothetical protein C493_08371 [Natronolimnohabitans innermongolicus JCM 12255]
MSTTITLEPADEIPADCRVCHYDELGESAKARLPALTRGPPDSDESSGRQTATADDAFLESLGDCDLVKFTDYYVLSVD